MRGMRVRSNGMTKTCNRLIPSEGGKWIRTKPKSQSILWRTKEWTFQSPVSIYSSAYQNKSLTNVQVQSTVHKMYILHSTRQGGQRSWVVWSCASLGFRGRGGLFVLGWSHSSLHKHTPSSVTVLTSPVIHRTQTSNGQITWQKSYPL